jgi:threonylcarbamoyladenosine tRNA methylthiotransferase MtaB
MPNQVPVQIARERNRVLRHLAAEKKLAFMRTFIGRELQAITLNVSGDDARGPWTEALTDNYLKMRIRGKQEANQWLAAQVSGIQDGTLVAVVKESSRFASLGHPSAGQNVQLRCPGAAGIAIS